ncbi:hypothetical protein [Agarivorans sp. QJM3NY_25]|uniref:hypothetical protein n=1 Tax=Agarivorans sp. QJM3NY_25 TaxID=3421430 RepID=UPI003D7CDBEC
MSNHPVKWFNSNFEGAPTVDDTWDNINGNFVAMLKACLVTGFGDKLIANLTYDETSSEAVANFDNGHQYKLDSIIEIYDASDAAYNGEHRVTNVTTNEVRVKLNSGPAGAVTGASMKVASAGWSVFSESPDGKVVVFDTGSDYGNVMIRVANNDTEQYEGKNLFGNSSTLCLVAKISLVSNVSDYNNYDVETEAIWPASHTGGSSIYQRKLWNLVADDGMFYLFFSTGYNGHISPHYAGYINSLKSNDLYHCVVNSMGYEYYPELNSTMYDFGYYNQQASQTAFHHNPLCSANHTDYRYLARAYTQLKSPSKFLTRGIFICSGTGMQSGNAPDGGVYISQGEIPVFEYKNKSASRDSDKGMSLRGTMPGSFEPYYSLYDESGGTNISHLEPRIEETERLVRFVTYFGIESIAANEVGKQRVAGEFKYEKSIGLDIGDKGWRL